MRKKVYIYYVPALNILYESNHPKVVAVNNCLFKMYKVFLIGEL
jgi:hypothetical protein